MLDWSIGTIKRSVPVSRLQSSSIRYKTKLFLLDSVEI